MKMQLLKKNLYSKFLFGLIVLSLGFSFLSCRNREVSYAYYFIPYGYTGFVNIIFNDVSSKNKIIQSGSTQIYFISGNPNRYSVSSPAPKSGEYISRYYYYTKDTLLEILDITQGELSQVFLEASASKEIGNFQGGKSMRVRVHQFYVADKPYKASDFYTKFPDLENNCCE